MLSFCSRPRRRRFSVRTRLSLEALEVRDCPSSVPSLTIHAVALGGATGRDVGISGEVTESDPTVNVANLDVHLGGIVPDTHVATDASGHYNVILTASPLGTQIYALAQDDAGNNSNLAATTVPHHAPVVTALLVECGTADTFVFTGHVAADFPASTYVTFSGYPAIEGMTAQVAADGNFALPIVLPYSSCDQQITVTATDAWGVTSNVYWVDVHWMYRSPSGG